MSTDSPTTADLAIRLIVQLVILAIIGFGLPIAITIGWVEPTGIDYDPDRIPIGVNYHFNFEFVRFIESLFRATISGLLSWLAPFLIMLQVFGKILRAILSKIVLSFFISLISLLFVTDFQSGFMGAYNYVMIVLVMAGSSIAAIYLAKHPIQIGEV